MNCIRCRHKQPPRRKSRELHPLSNQEPGVRQQISCTPPAKLRHRARTARDKGLADKARENGTQDGVTGCQAPHCLLLRQEVHGLKTRRTPANREGHVVKQAKRPEDAEEKVRAPSRSLPSAALASSDSTKPNPPAVDANDGPTSSPSSPYPSSPPPA